MPPALPDRLRSWRGEDAAAGRGAEDRSRSGRALHRRSVQATHRCAGHPQGPATRPAKPRLPRSARSRIHRLSSGRAARCDPAALALRQAGYPHRRCVRPAAKADRARRSPCCRRKVRAGRGRSRHAGYRFRFRAREAPAPRQARQFAVESSAARSRTPAFICSIRSRGPAVLESTRASSSATSARRGVSATSVRRLPISR